MKTEPTRDTKCSPHPRTLRAPERRRIVKFPSSMNDILVVNFVQDDVCWVHAGTDGDGNDHYKQVPCPWDTIVIEDDD